MSRSDDLKQLEWPREWGPARLSNKLILVIVAFGLVGLILIGPFAVDFFRHGESQRAAFGLVGGLTALTMAASLLPATRVRKKKLPQRLRVTSVDDHDQGLRIDVRASRRPLMTMWLLLGAGFLTLRGAISFGNYSTTDDPVLLGMNAGGIGVVAIILIAIVAVLSTMVFGRHKHFLAVTEDGITRAAGRSMSTLAWDDIDLISPVMYGNVHAVKITPRPRVKVAVQGGGLGRGELENSITILAWHLNIDPPLLLRMIRFYQRYPELRTELTSDAVIDRMRRADFRRPKSLRQNSAPDQPRDRSGPRLRSSHGLDSSPTADS